MSDNNEGLKDKIEKLEKKLEELEKKVNENTQKDKKHHEELKALQEKGNTLHDENKNWNKFGALSAPIATVLVGAFIHFLQSRQVITPQQIQPIKKDADDVNAKMGKLVERMDKIAELLEEQNKKK